MDIIQKVSELRLPIGQYVVFGSGPLAAHGIRPTRDVDIFATTALYNQLKATPGWEVKHWESNGAEYLANGVYEVDDVWNYGTYTPTIEELVAKTEVIQGVPFAPLEEVLSWKRAFGRPKDREDVKLIEDYMASQGKKLPLLA